MKIHKKQKIGLLATAGILLFAFLVFSAIFVPILSTSGYSEMTPSDRLTPPGRNYLLGTDELGRDLLVRSAYGLRSTLVTSISATIISLLIGTALGLFSGYSGGRIDALLMRLIDIMLTFPVILMAILLITIFGRGIGNVILAIGFAFIPSIARMARGQTLSIKEEAFVAAARLYGTSSLRIMAYHIIPNILGPLIVMATVNVSTAVLIESSLSFLGIGIRPPIPSMGLLISDGRAFIETAPWLILVPGSIITIMVISLNLIGDGLRDALDPFSNNK